MRLKERGLSKGDQVIGDESIEKYVCSYSLTQRVVVSIETCCTINESGHIYRFISYHGEWNIFRSFKVRE